MRSAIGTSGFIALAAGPTLLETDAEVRRREAPGTGFDEAGARGQIDDHQALVKGLRQEETEQTERTALLRERLEREVRAPSSSRSRPTPSTSAPRTARACSTVHVPKTSTWSCTHAIQITKGMSSAAAPRRTAAASHRWSLCRVIVSSSTSEQIEPAVEAASEEGLLAEAATAFRELVDGSLPDGAPLRREIELPGWRRRRCRSVDWLGELLFLAEVEGRGARSRRRAPAGRRPSTRDRRRRARQAGHLVKAVTFSRPRGHMRSRGRDAASFRRLSWYASTSRFGDSRLRAGSRAKVEGLEETGRETGKGVSLLGWSCGLDSG